MSEAQEEWFETVQVGEKRIPHVSKFLRKDFTVSRESIEERWSLWTHKEKLRFVAAFSAKGQLNDADQRLLDFLMENGDWQISNAIALSVVNHRDRNRAVTFLLQMLKEERKPLANYYQALEILRAAECVPDLKAAFLKHRAEIDQHPTLETWGDRFIYLDYLSCSATLFTVTGEEEYRSNLIRMLEHPDEAIKKMTRMVASTSGIAIELDDRAGPRDHGSVF
ncbi:MAG: hypothetical protein WCB11_25120 [Terriglobales bacterium]